MDVSRLHINEGARRNKQCAGYRRFLSPSRAPNFPLSLPLSRDVTKTGNGEWGMGNGNGEWEMGN